MTHLGIVHVQNITLYNNVLTDEFCGAKAMRGKQRCTLTHTEIDDPKKKAGGRRGGGYEDI